MFHPFYCAIFPTNATFLTYHHSLFLPQQSLITTIKTTAAMSFLPQLFKNCLVAAKDEEEEEEELISIDPGWLDRLVEL